jgi:hypothetical protein
LSIIVTCNVYVRLEGAEGIESLTKERCRNAHLVETGQLEPSYFGCCMSVVLKLCWRFDFLLRDYRLWQGSNILKSEFTVELPMSRWFQKTLQGSWFAVKRLMTNIIISWYSIAWIWARPSTLSGSMRWVEFTQKKKERDQVKWDFTDHWRHEILDAETAEWCTGCTSLRRSRKIKVFKTWWMTCTTDRKWLLPVSWRSVFNRRLDSYVSNNACWRWSFKKVWPPLKLQWLTAMHRCFIKPAIKTHGHAGCRL